MSIMNPFSFYNFQMWAPTPTMMAPNYINFTATSVQDMDDEPFYATSTQPYYYHKNRYQHHEQLVYSETFMNNGLPCHVLPHTSDTVEPSKSYKAMITPAPTVDIYLADISTHNSRIYSNHRRNLGFKSNRVLRKIKISCYQLVYSFNMIFKAPFSRHNHVLYPLLPKEIKHTRTLK